MQETRKGVDQENSELKKLLDDPEASFIFEVLLSTCLGCLREFQICIIYSGTKTEAQKLGFDHYFYPVQDNIQRKAAARALSRYIRTDDLQKRIEMLKYNHKLHRLLFEIYFLHRYCGTDCRRRTRVSLKEIDQALPYVLRGAPDLRIRDFRHNKAFLL
jgi:hypothetical protein